MTDVGLTKDGEGFYQSPAEGRLHWEVPDNRATRPAVPAVPPLPVRIVEGPELYFPQTKALAPAAEPGPRGHVLQGTKGHDPFRKCHQGL